MLDKERFICYTYLVRSQKMIQIVRVQFNGRIPAFQAGRVGSIPITRSTLLCACSSVGQSNCLLSSGSGVRISSGAPVFFIWWVWFSWVERQFVALNGVGSNPTTHPTLIYQGCRDRAKSVRHQILILAFRRFESCYPCHIWAISSGGRALDF